MKISLIVPTLLSLSILAVAGCSGGDGGGAPGAAAVDPAAAPVAADEAELRSPSFSGTYGAASSEDDQFFGEIKITQQGPKLVLSIDGTNYDLTKTRSGAYVFTSGDLGTGDCDDPGCYDITKVSGVVYLKKVGNAKKPTVKLNVRLEYPHPEYDGDIEGEQTSTLRWYKKR